MAVWIPSGNSQQNGISSMLSALGLDATAENKTSKPGYLSADGTIIKTDTDNLQKMQSKAAKEKQKLLKVRLGGQWRSSAVRAYARLARARTQQECKTVAYSASQQASQLKRALSLEDTQKTEIQAVLGQMQKAVMRAKLKVRQIDEEQLLQRQQHRAEEQRRRAKALYLEQQRQKKAVLRQVRESGYIRESVVARYQAAERVRQQLAAEIAAPSNAPDTAIPTATASAPPTAAPAPTIEGAAVV